MLVIPETQFYVFHVISPFNTPLGMYFTFGEAYDRISEMVKGKPLVETNATEGFCVSYQEVPTKYCSPERPYTIYIELLTYNPIKDNLITYNMMHTENKAKTVHSPLYN